MRKTVSLPDARLCRIFRPEPTPKFIFAENPRPGIYNEIQARLELFSGITNGCISIRYLKGRIVTHYFWVLETDEETFYAPVFKDDYVPRDIYQRKTRRLHAWQFFNYKNRLYIIIETQDKTIKVEELDIHTTSFEALAMAKEDGLPKEDEVEAYIAKVSRIYHNNKAYETLGYCWRVVGENFLSDFPLFVEDFTQIKNVCFNELHYEEVLPGEKIFHNGLLWEVCQTKEFGVFLNQKSVPMQIITNNIINS